MARVGKKGLDYFPMDTHFVQDRKVRRLMKREGDKALCVLLAVYSYLYDGEGYYLKVDGECFEDIAATFYGITADEVAHIVDVAVEIGLFDRCLYDERRILTSTFIQKQYLYVKKRAASRIIDSELNLLSSASEMEEPSSAPETEDPSLMPERERASSVSETKSSSSVSETKSSSLGPETEESSLMPERERTSLASEMKSSSLGPEMKAPSLFYVNEEGSASLEASSAGGKPVEAYPTAAKCPQSKEKQSKEKQSRAKQKKEKTNLLLNPPPREGEERAAEECADISSTKREASPAGEGPSVRTGTQRARKSWTMEEIRGLEPPADGVRRNFAGLLESLCVFSIPPDEQYAIIRKSNYGAIGHPVWKGLYTLRGCGGRIRLPGRYLLSL